MKNNHQSIALIGFMGTGKSTIAALLAKELNFQLIDTDAVIEKKAGRTISDIFKDDGEDYFRALETQVLQSLVVNDHQVMATGGGIILKEENRHLLKSHTYLVCLTASAKTIYQRTKKDQNRPLLSRPDPQKQIDHLLAQRQDYYQIAHLTINTDGLNIDFICEKILSHYRK